MSCPSTSNGAPPCPGDRRAIRSPVAGPGDHRGPRASAGAKLVALVFPGGSASAPALSWPGLDCHAGKRPGSIFGTGQIGLNPARDPPDRLAGVPHDVGARGPAAVNAPGMA